jgi:cytidylate kinase
MEGRDIGTVVFPEAQVKFYLDASPRIRADRRASELNERGVECSIDDLVREIEDRDSRDRARAHSPLRQAEDAIYLDTSSLAPAEVEDEILRVVRARTSNGKSLTRQHVE